MRVVTEVMMSVVMKMRWLCGQQCSGCEDGGRFRGTYIGQKVG